jgi:transcriptional regulator with XRE-family HTH domain
MSAKAIPETDGIRQYRLAAGISQQKLAQLAGCSLSMVRLVESGYRPSTSDVLDRIATVLEDDDPATTGPLADTTTTSGASSRGEG